MDTLLDAHPQVNLVFAQNDRMAIGAYEKARQKNRAGQIAFVGVDAVAGGVESVAEGKLDATFIYPTGGDKVIQVAMAILRGEPYQRENILFYRVGKSCQCPCDADADEAYSDAGPEN